MSVTRSFVAGACLCAASVGVHAAASVVDLRTLGPQPTGAPYTLAYAGSVLNIGPVSTSVSTVVRPTFNLLRPVGALLKTTASVVPVVSSSLSLVLEPGAYDTFQFDLAAKSDVFIDFYGLAGVTLGGSFGLYNSGNQLIGSQKVNAATHLGSLVAADASALGLDATLGVFSHYRLTFAKVAAGNDYQFRFDPGLLTAAISYKVKFSAAAVPTPPAVPEPETYALVLAGLAVVGTHARRRTLRPHGAAPGRPATGT